MLNEDGQFSGPPYSQGSAFDLGILSDQGYVQPQPLKLLPTLTLDGAGSRQRPVVEVSVDGGVSWLTYAGVFVVRDDRAAVYFDDVTLPGAFLTAAKQGLALVRVTASLQSPVPVQAVRWSGNPFVGLTSDRVLDVGDAFRFRRVLPGSINYNGVRSGNLSADEIDERRAWRVG